MLQTVPRLGMQVARRRTELSEGFRVDGVGWRMTRRTGRASGRHIMYGEFTVCRGCWGRGMRTGRDAIVPRWATEGSERAARREGSKSHAGTASANRPVLLHVRLRLGERRENERGEGKARRRSGEGQGREGARRVRARLKGGRGGRRGLTLGRWRHRGRESLDYGVVTVKGAQESTTRDQFLCAGTTTTQLHCPFLFYILFSCIALLLLDVHSPFSQHFLSFARHFFAFEIRSSVTTTSPSAKQDSICNSVSFYNSSPLSIYGSPSE
ncbi:hypothetical protein C8R43DRAFT_240106 [Mycena crocata]|nr:hypothetical protein C8R43DRAFT_240106 [Mycena crocata]